MIIKRFKLIYLPEGTSTKREFNIHKGHVLTLLGVAALAFFIFSGAMAYVFNNWFNAQTISTLTQTNSKLEKQLKVASNKLETLTQSVDHLAHSNGELRAYAHLPLLDADVLKMGIGGALPADMTDSTGAENLLTRLDHMEREVGLQEKSLVDIQAGLQDQEDLLKSLPSIRPCNEGAFSSFFGHRRDPFNGRWEPHMGLDINASTGTPVHATADGVVIHAEREPAYGNIVVIDHGHGYKTIYAHLSRFNIARGQKVKRGDIIGFLGNTGRSTGPHLHYEVLRYNQNLDPLDFMFDGYAMAKLP
jgi:murein DD-endopeptidase MepM/ murein hydrolase activator NlpD